jgi:hypothetical protein
MSCTRQNAAISATAAADARPSRSASSGPQTRCSASNFAHSESTNPPFAAARAAAADVAFDERDVQRRLMIFERERGPEPGEPSADDAHVGVGVTVQRRLVVGRFERLLEPQAPVLHPYASGAIGYWKSPFLTSSGATATILPLLIWTSTGGGTVLSWKWSPEDSNLIGP